jgi:hypothetical protein
MNARFERWALLSLTLSFLVFLSGCVQSSDNPQPNFSQDYGNTTSPLEFNIVSADWAQWRADSSQTICESLKTNDFPYKTVINAEINCNRWAETYCKVKIDGVSGNDIICASGASTVMIGHMVDHNGEKFSGVDVTKDHLIEICCEDACKSVAISKLC